jgi:hypothetical protein
VLGGVPKTVLADRMGCLKGGAVANKVVIELPQVPVPPLSDYRYSAYRAQEHKPDRPAQAAYILVGCREIRCRP